MRRKKIRPAIDGDDLIFFVYFPDQRVGPEGFQNFFRVADNEILMSIFLAKWIVVIYFIDHAAAGLYILIAETYNVSFDTVFGKPFCIGIRPVCCSRGFREGKDITKNNYAHLTSLAFNTLHGFPPAITFAGMLLMT